MRIFVLFCLLIFAFAIPSISYAQVAGTFRCSINAGICGSNIDFDDTTPPPPANAVNNKWQSDSLTPKNISSYLPFVANDFNLSGSDLAIDYTNAQKATTSVPGLLTDVDWDTFNDKQTLITWGSGLAYSAPTASVDSAETGFFASGALTCGAGTAGRARVHTTPFQYCDNAGTPALQYAAYGDSAGTALSGDTATAFFSAGTIEDARLPTSMADKIFTGSLQIPNGTAPTVDAAGEIAEDTTATIPQLLYGANPNVLTALNSKCATIETVVAADDDMPIGSFPYGVTITGVWCHYKGSAPTTAATFTLEDGNANAMTITGTNPTCAAPTANATIAAVTAANTLVSGELMRFDTTNTPNPATDTYEICYQFTVTRQ